MIQLTPGEKETIITFNEADPEAEVFTYSPRWQKHMKDRFGLKGEPNDAGAKTYIIPKSRIRLPQPPKNLTAEQRRKIGERLSKGRKQKPPG